MIFNFIRYTQPAWQFNLWPYCKGSFPSCYANKNDLKDYPYDERFSTRSAAIADAGYFLWSTGHLLKSSADNIQQLHELDAPSLKDEYIFIRKYWSAAWAAFALLVRICSLKNPIKEIIAYAATRKIKRVYPHLHAKVYDGYENFQSHLVISNPKVAVIIPTLNRYHILKDVLHDLELQQYKNFEVIIVDQSDDFNEAFYKPFQLNIRVFRQQEKLLWTARNFAVKKTNAEYLLFFDDDSRVQPQWITEHLKCLDFFNADISAGVSLAIAGQKIPANYSFFRWADQFDSGNAMIKRKVMQQIGMFSEMFNGMRMGDGEFGYRAYMHGIRSISNPRASRIHLKESKGGLREMGSWDGFRPKKIFAPKPVPSVIYLFKKYFPPQLARNALLIGIMLSNVPYKSKGSSSMLALSFFLTILKSPLLLFQYMRANSIAKKMLANEKQIEILSK